MKILVIGGGPAGATAARLLSKNYKVTLIQDKDWDKPCGGGVKTKIFDELELNKSLIRHFQDRVYIKYHNETIEIPLKGDNLSIVFRKEFDKYLRDVAVESGVKLFYGRFKGFENGKAVVKVASEKILFDYDILIAADGVNSSVRKALHLSPVPSTITHYARIEKSTKYCNFYFDEEIGGKYYAWDFPHGDLAHIGSVTRANFEALCKKLNVNVSPKGYKIPTWQEGIKIRYNNVYFVGDAAGQVMPLSFEGIYYAIKSAEILANSIENNLDYQFEWEKRFLKEFKFMKFLEGINKTHFRKYVVKLNKFNFFKSFVINFWLGDKNV